MVSRTVKYRRAGVQPPVFVAGTYTKPEWVPRQMDLVLDDRGESFFAAEIEVEANREYQYKFKLGHGNDWDLDENCPTALDNIGNTNNLLIVSSHSGMADSQQEVNADNAPPPAAVKSMPTNKLRSSKPADTERREVASESSLGGSLRQPQHERTPELIAYIETPRPITPAEEGEMPSTPLFAHESLGAYDFDVVEDGFDHSLSPSATRNMSITSLSAFAAEDLAQNIDDPTLEIFPSEKASVMNTLRRISTSTGEAPISLEDRPFSPRLASRSTSVDSTADSAPSPESLSPTSSRKRDSRLSHSSVGRTKSAVSLGLIVEEPQRHPSKAVPEMEAFSGDEDALGLTSEDEGPQMRSSKRRAVPEDPARDHVGP